MQPSNIDRSTVTVRVPRKYYFLVRAFIAFLKLKARRDAKAVEVAEQEVSEFYANADDRSYVGILLKGEKMVDILRKHLQTL